ncbi:MAG: PAS domain-containing sensor histidine kinase [Candidatus Aminicenantaceae bacterium]
MKSIKNWSLKSKIILHILIIGMLTALFLTFLYIGTQRNIIHTMSRQKVELVGSIIENSIFAAMKEGKIGNIQTSSPKRDSLRTGELPAAFGCMTWIQTTIQELASSRAIKKIRFLTPQGKIIQSTDEKEIGSLPGSNTIQHLEEFLLKKTQSNIIFIKQKSTIQSFHIIENRRECFDCHSSKKRINGILEVNIDYTASSALLKKSQFKGIILAIFAVTTLTLIILRLFEKLINRPISKLKEKMREVQDGNLNIQFPSVRNDEIGSLAKSFNVMIHKLKDANNKIETLFNQQIEKAEHLASVGELAAGLAHEIKNPIAGMKGALEIINQKTDPYDEKKEIFIEMLSQTEKINRVIQDLLSYAKPKEMSFSSVNPNECIKNALKLAKSQMNSKEISIHYQGIENHNLVSIDADKIQEVILNLMLNSISAIGEKGQISIVLDKKNNKELEIMFSDDGIGIKNEYLSQIFNPFFTTKNRGTGLGLSICKKIIEAHNGSIEVESNEGQGTTFIIRLPVIISSD